MNKIGIIGAGGHAKEVASYADSEVAFFAVENEYASDGLVCMEVASVEERNTPIVCAVGSPLVRKKLIEKWPGDKYATVIADTAYVDKSATINEGTQVGVNAIVMIGCQIGRHCLLNIASTISHGCELGDYATVSPGAHLGGDVRVGEGAFIGIGATISNKVKIANGVVVGAGSVLIHDADVENGVYVGVPAKLIKTNSEWISVI